MRAAKNELALAPVVNTLRHPRWARAQETYGEDPVLLGEMGAAFVRGMQQPGGSAACPKHYVLNDTDNNRMPADPNVDDQTLHENYTRPLRSLSRRRIRRASWLPTTWSAALTARRTATF